jgi:hypothetical protein
MQGTKAMNAADAQSSLKLYYPVKLEDLGAAQVTGSSPNYNVNISYGSNGMDGTDIVLNSEYFPNDTVQNINVGGLMQSALNVFNKANGSSLTGPQLEEFVILHEFYHLTQDGINSAVNVDSLASNTAIIKNCIN